MILPPELIDRVDAWRYRQPGPPPRAAAIRWLVEQALDRLSGPPEQPV